MTYDGYDSAERAWYKPPEYDNPTPPENDISVKQFIIIMNRRNSIELKKYFESTVRKA